MKNPFQLWKRGNIYYFHLPEEKNFHSTGITTKMKAIDYVYKKIQEEETQKPLEVKFKEYADNFYVWDKCDYIKRQQAKGRSISKTHAAGRRSHLINHIFPRFGKTLLQDLNAIEVENWLVGLPLANGTKNDILYSFGIILREAKRERLIASNPLNDVERMADLYREHDPFSLEDITKLFPTDEKELLRIWRHPKWAVMNYTMLTSGMRCGEAGAVQWKHVIWDLHGLLVLKAIKSDNVIGPTKGNENRAVIMPARTEQLLKWWRDQSPYSEQEHLIFFGRDGSTHLNAKTIGRKIPPAMVRAGIEMGDRWLSAHSLRHTYNTRLQKLLPEAMLRYMIGHKSRAMTRRYTHITPEERLVELQSALEQIDSAWE